MITRRHALKSTLATLATTAAIGPLAMAAENPPAPAAPAPAGPFKLDPLPYATDALEPHIDARTMEIHHGKHHAAYVANLNKALASQPALATKSPEDLIRQLDQVPEAVRTAVRNNGGGHLNHTWFWHMMSPKGGGEPKGALAEAIAKSFGSFDAFKQEFTKAALGQFGSGWAWLCWSPTTHGLSVRATPNQDNPLSEPHQAGGIPLLGLDVWEHAYYLKYQNRRADYAAAFFNVVHWDLVAQRFEKASQA